MSEAHGSTEFHHEQYHHEHRLYEIRLHGHLDARRIHWFEGLSLTHESDGTTIFTVQVIDQPALYGVLRKVRDFGMPLVSVIQVDPKQNLSKKKETNT